MNTPKPKRTEITFHCEYWMDGDYYRCSYSDNGGMNTTVFAIPPGIDGTLNVMMALDILKDNYDKSKSPGIHEDYKYS